MNDHTCQVLHRSIDRICDSRPRALEDTDARGYTASGYGVNRTQTEDTPVEAAALTESKAAAWLAELADTLIGFGIKTYRQQIVHIRQRMHRPWPATLSKRATNTSSLALSDSPTVPRCCGQIRRNQERSTATDNKSTNHADCANYQHRMDVTQTDSYWHDG